MESRGVSVREPVVLLGDAGQGSFAGDFQQVSRGFVAHGGLGAYVL